MDITNSTMIEALATLFGLVTQMQEGVDQACNPDVDEFDTQVFTLEPLPEEQNLQVSIKVRQEVERDCNNMWLWATLEPTHDGHYLIKQPTGLSTLMACREDSRRMEIFDVSVKGAVIDYDSRTPIVIHAAKGLLVSYEVQARAPTN
nr:ecotin family protein [uncultured Pseudomonas sp.]